MWKFVLTICEIAFIPEDCSGKQNNIELFFVLYGCPNPGPGCLPLDAGRGNFEFPPVESAAVSFVPDGIFRNHVQTNNLKHARAMVSLLQ